MRDDPFYLFKDKSLKASLGVLSVDGNFEDSIAYFDFFVKFSNKAMQDIKMPNIEPTKDISTNKNL